MQLKNLSFLIISIIPHDSRLKKQKFTLDDTLRQRMINMYLYNLTMSRTLPMPSLNWFLTDGNFSIQIGN